MNWLKKLALGLLTAAMILGAAEAVLRLTVPREALLFTWERPDGAMFFEQTGNLTMRPDREDRHHDGPYEWTFRTNGQGLREDAEIPYAKPDGQTRLLALGDSWIFGLNATQGEALPDQLERLLPARAGLEEGAVEVINAGVAGGSAFDMLQQWRQTAAFEVDGLLLGLPHNDGRQREVQSQREAFYQGSRNAPASDARLYLGLRRLLAPWDRPSYPQIVDVDAAVADVAAIAAEAHARGLPIWMVYWPTAWEHVDNVLDLKPWLRALAPYDVRVTGHALDQRSCWGYQDDVHPSEAGYRVLGEIVAELIAGGAGSESPLTSPTCDDVPGNGPGKPGYPDPDDGPSLRHFRHPPAPGKPMNPPLPEPGR